MTRPRLWIRLDLGAAGRIGPGKMRLLRAIREHRSISAAARASGMSYRRAWVLVDELNASLASPAVTTHVGGAGRGGAAVTSAGERLMELYDTMQVRAAAAVEGELEAIDDLVRR